MLRAPDEFHRAVADMRRVAARPTAAASHVARFLRLVGIAIFTVIPAALALVTREPWLLVFTFLPFAIWFAWAAVLTTRDGRRTADRLRGEVAQLTRRELRLDHIIRPATEIEPSNPEIVAYFNDRGACHWMMFGIVNNGTQAVLRTRLVRESVRGLRSLLSRPGMVGGS